MGFKNINIGVVGICLLLLLSYCEKEKCTKIYNPILEVSINNLVDTILKNDTFLFSCRSKSSLYNFETNEIINFNKFNFDFIFFIRKFYDTANYETSVDMENGTNCFEIIDIIGTHEKISNFDCRVFHQSINDSLNFLFKIIPKKSGLYYLSMGNHQLKNNHKPKNIKVTDSECKEYFNFLCPRFNNGNVNKYLIDHINEFKRPTPFTDLEIFQKQNSVYYFYVK